MASTRNRNKIVKVEGDIVGRCWGFLWNIGDEKSGLGWKESRPLPGSSIRTFTLVGVLNLGSTYPRVSGRATTNLDEKKKVFVFCFVLLLLFSQTSVKFSLLLHCESRAKSHSTSCSSWDFVTKIINTMFISRFRCESYFRRSSTCFLPLKVQ